MRPFSARHRGRRALVTARTLTHTLTRTLMLALALTACEFDQVSVAPPAPLVVVHARSHPTWLEHAQTQGWEQVRPGRRLTSG